VIWGSVLPGVWSPPTSPVWVVLGPVTASVSFPARAGSLLWKAVQSLWSPFSRGAWDPKMGRDYPKPALL
jgi:hypothetical protein